MNGIWEFQWQAEAWVLGFDANRRRSDSAAKTWSQIERRMERTFATETWPQGERARAALRELLTKCLSLEVSVIAPSLGRPPPSLPPQFCERRGPEEIWLRCQHERRRNLELVGRFLATAAPESETTTPPSCAGLEFLRAWCEAVLTLHAEWEALSDDVEIP